ncbi:MAG: hypothetical protein LBI95_01575 [Holosporales bacterium]|jgi:hypothetical protein|nr:hypothetical protein [Holosporales bacterium]
MNSFSNFMGIDVSKHKIDIFCTAMSSRFSVPNKRPLHKRKVGFIKGGINDRPRQAAGY